jgi:lipopolysaccharide/colanic/teichoic acid biosynthesis glycosyltransferase
VIRFLDVVLSAVGLAAAAPLMVFIVVVGYFDTGAPLFRQVRVGRNQKPFVLYKFRTMRVDAPQVATHEASPELITPWGRFLRRSKLDELPQLWNVLKGDMSLVGPRPCLPTQTELIAERERLGVFAVRPGMTGLAQLSGIDMSTPGLLAETDAKMLRERRVRTYLRHVLDTALGRGRGDRVRVDRTHY